MLYKGTKHGHANWFSSLEEGVEVLQAEKMNKKGVLEAVKKGGNVLEYPSEELQADKVVVPEG